MRGSMVHQVTQLFNKSKIFQAGRSKHAAKSAARKNGAKTWADMGRSLAIYSYKTAESYKDTWHQFANYSKMQLNLDDIEKTSAEHVHAYLIYRIANGVALATFAKEASALCKLENALNLYAERYATGYQYDLRKGISAVVKEARWLLPKADPHRAYTFAEVVIGNIGNEKHRVAAQAQLLSGARIHEIALIKIGQLRGIDHDKDTGEQHGKIEVKGKGGKIRDLCVTPEIYEKISDIIKTNGVFRIDKNKYRADVRRACEICDVEYKGTHGFRWTYAQNRMAILQSVHNKTYEEALLLVSKELGHERPDITEHYLR